ncbi:hypothetical protein D3C86_1891090 [compost metagenome]
MYHLVVNKENITDEELLDIARNRLEEPDHVTHRRQSDEEMRIWQGGMDEI